jgi:hypothetical protein
MVCVTYTNTTLEFDIWNRTYKVSQLGHSPFLSKIIVSSLFVSIMLRSRDDGDVDGEDQDLRSVL